jgi:predicted RND superfamily exporter protein
MDPKCVYDIYSKNNVPLNTINNPKYNNYINGSPIKSKSDPKLDKQSKDYRKYYDNKKDAIKIINEEIINEGNIFSEYDETVYQQNEQLNNEFINSFDNSSNITNILSNISSALGNKEGFDNKYNNYDNKKTNFLFIMLIIFSILFLFYMFRKK